MWEAIKNFFKNLFEKEPDRPSVELKDPGYTMPTIVRVPGIKYSIRGQYKTSTGKALGLVVHYTVSGRTEKSAKSVMNSLAKRGLGCMVMDENGVIYIPEKFDLEKDVAYHAGTSSWRGKSGMSFYCMGMEICNWGKLDDKTKNYAGKTRTSPGVANIKAGTYEAYTDAQESALTNFIKWQLDVNPEFRIDYLCGHDETSPSRKSDPGASLSMTMPRFRELFR